MNHPRSSDEIKQATERFLKVMDKNAPEGSVRTAVPLVHDDQGKPVWGIICWRKL